MVGAHTPGVGVGVAVGVGVGVGPPPFEIVKLGPVLDPSLIKPVESHTMTPD